MVQQPDSKDKWVCTNKLGQYYAWVGNVHVIFENNEEFGEAIGTP